jgi:imidazoleglycerol-phosphate dehydratase
MQVPNQHQRGRMNLGQRHNQGNRREPDRPKPPEQNSKIRRSEVNRSTTETQIGVKLTVDGSGNSDVKTGIPFLDHMLTLFSRHGYFDLFIKGKGDTNVDIHHTNEDVAITLGEAFTKALGEKRGIRRFGFFYVPMGETLVRIVLDISNRPYVSLVGFPSSSRTNKEYNYSDCDHFLQSFAQSAGLNLNVAILSGGDRHHVIEAIFKCLGKALDMATSLDERSSAVPSTKGIL